MGGPCEESRKKYIRISHNRVEGDHCRIEEPEILNQGVGPTGLLNCKYKGVKKGRNGVKKFCP